jgi:NAD-dependent deacetylase
MKKKVLIFSGAGLDKESGVDTFRDSSDGLWHKYKVGDVATMDAWENNTQIVIDFYNKRKDALKDVVPNIAHEIIADLEKDFDVTVVTQNITNLHEKAGSTNVIHLHGEITKLRSTYNCDTIKEYTEDLFIGDLCPEGGQYRPDVVLFGEDLDFMKMHNAKVAAADCDVCVVIGTSMKVSPANTIPWSTNNNSFRIED